MPSIDYRPDIDGLRAVAVLAVIGFHAGIKGFSAGFIGVDVFFVVSGYLITGIILRQLAAENFSFADFYVRRANRILPALLVMIAGILLIAWTVLYPEEFRRLGDDVIGGGTFSSNFILWRDTSYFTSRDKPLLHLWSLAVEEQFYLVWPVVVWAVWRSHLRTTTRVIAAVSFVLCLWFASTGHQTATFFSPVTRFWEIMTGALLAEAECSQRTHLAAPNSISSISEIRSLIGAGLLLLGMGVIRPESAWPGFLTLIPVAGTASIVIGGSSSLVSRKLLSSRVLVGIGLVSYPLYLWHWPLIVLARTVKGFPLSGRAIAVVLIVSFILSVLTYRFLEVPIRFGAHRRRSALVLAPLLLVVALAGFLMQKSSLLPRIDAPEAKQVKEALNDWTFPRSGGIAAWNDSLLTSMIPGDSTRRVFFVGDSHAEQYWPRMMELSKERGRVFPETVFLTYGGCSPFPGTSRAGIAWHGGPFRCAEFFSRAMAELRRRNAKTVVFASAWDSDLGTDRFFADANRTRIEKEGPTADRAFDQLGDSIANLKASGIEVFLVLSNPESSAFDPNSLLPGRLPWRSVTTHAKAISRDEFNRFTAAASSQLRRIAARTAARLIDPATALCNATSCPTIDSAGSPIYRDYNHLRASYAAKHATFMDVVVGR